MRYLVFIIPVLLTGCLFTCPDDLPMLKNLRCQEPTPKVCERMVDCYGAKWDAATKQCVCTETTLCQQAGGYQQMSQECDGSEYEVCILDGKVCYVDELSEKGCVESSSPRALCELE